MAKMFIDIGIHAIYEDRFVDGKHVDVTLKKVLTSMDGRPPLQQSHFMDPITKMPNSMALGVFLEAIPKVLASIIKLAIANKIGGVDESLLEITIQEIRDLVEDENTMMPNPTKIPKKDKLDFSNIIFGKPGEA